MKCVPIVHTHTHSSLHTLNGNVYYVYTCLHFDLFGKSDVCSKCERTHKQRESDREIKWIERQTMFRMIDMQF